MTACVHYQRQDDIGVIRIDNPPVNALGQAVRSGLLEALEQGLADDAVRVLVLMAEGRTFIAGADIREFGKPPRSPLLPEVIAHLEASPKPVVAALHGTALGGGLEVALGCHLRVALPGTRVGLPEVKLGLLPGAGGTQRLPRLTGIAPALELITSGRLVDAEEALALGILDRISEAETPLEAALDTARAVLVGDLPTRRTGELPAPAAKPQAVADCRQALERDCPELYSPFRALEAIEASSRLPLEEGLAFERRLFLDCMSSPQRAGLIHAFFAARAPHRVPEVEDVPALTRLALLGDHPLFETLRHRGERAGITLSEKPEGVEACLLAPGRQCTAGETLRIAIVSPEAANRAVDAELLLVVPAEAGCVELVDLGAGPPHQQAVAKALKALRLSVVVSRGESILACLQRAMEGSESSREALERAALEVAEAGLAYRHSDIDLLAIEALGYPRHLGGPHYQATAGASTPSSESTP
ncbi:enoyl-CoA hydratase/isomerase family protein [Halomonas cerina]|uniref:3-hydroxyacyl-CoA dehydrogenase n=1 Tax=Halomonas cerina TaxID=447424 RepID=A0A839VI99_9GAMM|nr:enoyl-CoA hydratase/isomerase family protein [Halomonas cerina]MBB3192116.1 3-hydroxyacyl-CoA dehydrogenase [Halomonas cerina]